MTVAHGGEELYQAKRAKLGQDALRKDASPQKLWEKVRASRKSVASLLMDQAFFAGVGNIYRCEILFVAGLHPDVRGRDLTPAQFSKLWDTTVSLLQRGFRTGYDYECFICVYLCLSVFICVYLFCVSNTHSHSHSHSTFHISHSHTCRSILTVDPTEAATLRRPDLRRYRLRR